MTETFETGEENGWQDLHRHTNTNANTTAGGNEVELLQSGMTGAMIFLSLNKGDTIDLSVQANYEADPTNTNWVPIAESALFSSWNAAYGGLEATEATESVFGQALTGATMAGKDDGSTAAPMAFLNFIFFDKDMQYEAAGFKQISTAARGIGVHEPVQLDEPFIADREGYILAYLSNENQEAVNVHFDDFTVYHGKTNIVSASDYYPFGLSFNDSQRTASIVQRFKFNGKEEQPKLGWYDFGARMLDPTIGRFMQVDPLANVFQESLTPYHYVKNNPIKYVDPTGMIWEDQKQADRLKMRIEKRKKQLAKKRAKKQAKKAKRSAQGKSTKSQEKAIATIDQRTDQMNQSISDIDALGADQNNTYRLASGDNQGAGKHGVTKGNDGVINIYGTNDGLHIHEIRHTALSLASAEGLSFDKGNNLLGTSPQTHGADDEVEGYKAQWGYTGSGPGAGETRWDVIENIANLKDSSGNYVYSDLRNKYYLIRLRGIRSSKKYQNKIKKGKTVKFKQK